MSAMRRPQRFVYWIPLLTAALTSCTISEVKRSNKSGIKEEHGYSSSYSNVVLEEYEEYIGSTVKAESIAKTQAQIDSANRELARLAEVTVDLAHASSQVEALGVRIGLEAQWDNIRQELNVISIYLSKLGESDSISVEELAALNAGLGEILDVKAPGHLMSFLSELKEEGKRVRDAGSDADKAFDELIGKTVVIVSETSSISDGLTRILAQAGKAETQVNQAAKLREMAEQAKQKGDESTAGTKAQEAAALDQTIEAAGKSISAEFSKVKEEAINLLSLINELKGNADRQEEIEEVAERRRDLEDKIRELKADKTYRRFEFLKGELEKSGQSQSAAAPAMSPKAIREEALKEEVTIQKKKAEELLGVMGAAGDGVSPSAYMAQRNYVHDIDRVYARLQERSDIRSLQASSVGNYKGQAVQSSKIAYPWSSIFGVTSEWDTYSNTGGEVRISQGESTGIFGLPVEIARQIVSLVHEIFSGESSPELIGAAGAAAVALD